MMKDQTRSTRTVQRSKRNRKMQFEGKQKGNGKRKRDIEVKKNLQTNKKRRPETQTDGEEANKQEARENWIKLRSCPKRFADVIKGLSKPQRQWVDKSGFGDLLSFQLLRFPHTLSYNLVSGFDPETCTLKLKCGTIPISEHDVSEVLGFPHGNKKIKFLKNRKTQHEWRAQFRGIKREHKITAVMVYKKLRASRVADWRFKMNFMILLWNLFVEAPTNSYVNQAILGFVGDIEKLKAYNWCELVIENLILASKIWLANPTKKHYKEPLPLLLFLYMDRVNNLPRRVERLIPTFKGWTDYHIKNREQFEISNRTFGLGKLSKALWDSGVEHDNLHKVAKEPQFDEDTVPEFPEEQQFSVEPNPPKERQDEQPKEGIDNQPAEACEEDIHYVNSADIIDRP